jgi:DeoR family transcriptional regulator, aga operon transcriptional repressor
VAKDKKRSVKLLAEERRRRIVELVDKQNHATVEELVPRFHVSAVTIRGDLEELHAAGLLVRTHGGALKRLDQQDVPIAVKETLHHGEKVRIGHAAAQLIKESETVILDSGTTTMEIARQLKFLKLKQLTVITNALNIAMELASLPHIRVIMIGGILRQMSYSTVGPQAEQLLRGLYADRLFLGIDGLDPDIGLTTPDVHEAQLNALMIKVAREVTAVADSSKFFRRTLSSIAGLHEIHRIITDDKVDQQIVATLRARNLEVMVV